MSLFFAHFENNNSGFFGNSLKKGMYQPQQHEKNVDLKGELD